MAKVKIAHSSFPGTRGLSAYDFSHNSCGNIFTPLRINSAMGSSVQVNSYE